MNYTEFDDRSCVARFQKPEENGNIKCILCPHECTLREGHSGLCRTRKNIHGTLYSLSYGRPCSIDIDPIEKKPLFHFYPGRKILSLATAGCNFHCLNCQNWQISQTSPQNAHPYIEPIRIVDAALSQNVGFIAFTYTEPTVFYEYMYDIAQLSREKDIKTVIVSNGFINHDPLVELCSLINAANIDLKCFDEATYKKLTGGRLSTVLETLLTLKQQNVWLEITFLLIPEFNDDLEKIKKMCEWLVRNGFDDTPLHISRFFPAYKLSHLPPTPTELLLNAREIAKNSGIRYVYIGNVRHSESENTYCPQCGNLLIERKGFSVTKNHVEDGRCPYCNTQIAGTWG